MQIEANEEKFAAEAKKDEEEILRLKAALEKDEELAAKATTKAEKLKLLKEEKVKFSCCTFCSIQKVLLCHLHYDINHYSLTYSIETCYQGETA